jgi:hypothetical protein
MSTILDRDALYYPYIHIRDVNWLKGTLLCFPQVRRMVPPDFYLNDSPEVQEFRKLTGFGGKSLISEENIDKEMVFEAQHRLLLALRENEEYICQQYSRDVAMNQYPKEHDSFQIHGGKMMEELVEYLKSKQLAWPTSAVSGGYAQWYSLHPKLGEVVMSLIAINIALCNGLDIVTDSGQVHHALASLDEKEVFQNLVRHKSPKEPMEGPKKVAELTDELALMVMTTRFDLTRLSAAQIAEMIKDGKDLRRFKEALVPIAETIPDILNPIARQSKLKEKAEEVISQWNEYKKSLPRFALDALIDVSDIKVPEIVSGIMLGATTGFTLATGFGLAVGFLTYSGYRVIRKYRDNKNQPYQFLSKLEKAGMSLATRPESLRASKIS